MEQATRITRTRSSIGTSRHLAQPAALDFVHEPPHVLGGDEGAGVDAGDRLADIVVEVGKASRANGGRMPVSAAIWSFTSSSRKVSMPQSVWWTSMISVVPSSRCEMASDRMTSSLMTPPALRMTWASPEASPRIACGSRRASMHATTAT
jgi:hypothetical protein